MKTSETGVALIKREEGFASRQYICPAGKLTIGYGHVIKPSEKFDTLTETQADILLRGDLLYYESAVNQCISVDISQNQFDALVSFAYNLGTKSLLGSHLLQYLNDGKIQDAANEFPKWDHMHDAQGNAVEVQGLKNRRITEQQLFLS